MAKVCQCCGRGPVTGNAVSHSNRHTRRRWLINLQTVRIDAGDGTTFKVRVCTKCLKSGFVKRAAAVSAPAAVDAGAAAPDAESKSA